MRKGRTILHYNFKGGVGKTVLTAMSAYTLSKYHNKKVLLVDFDPQANLTYMIGQTYNKEFKPTVDLLRGMEDENLTSSICKASDNVDIIPGTWKLTSWPTTIRGLSKPNRFLILNYLLKDIKHNYDYVLIDVPPTLAAYSMNAIFAADYIDIVLETQQAPYLSALKTVATLQDCKNHYHAKFNFIGVILYLMINAKTDRKVARKSIKMFSGALYKNRIFRQERVKGFSMNGISNKDGWDRRAMKMYKKITSEMLDRVKEVSK